MQPILDIEHLAELYQKLKGSIFLRLVSYIFGDNMYLSDVKEKLKDKPKEGFREIYVLKRDLTFEEFVYRCQNQF